MVLQDDIIGAITGTIKTYKKFGGFLVKAGNNINTFLILEALQRILDKKQIKVIVFRNSMRDTPESIARRISLIEKLDFDYDILEIGDIESVVQHRLHPYSTNHIDTYYVEDHFFGLLARNMNFVGFIPYSKSQILFDTKISLMLDTNLVYPLMCFCQSQLESLLDSNTIRGLGLVKEKLTLDNTKSAIPYDILDKILHQFITGGSLDLSSLAIPIDTQKNIEFRLISLVPILRCLCDAQC